MRKNKKYFCVPLFAFVVVVGLGASLYAGKYSDQETSNEIEKIHSFYQKTDEHGIDIGGLSAGLRFQGVEATRDCMRNADPKELSSCQQVQDFHEHVSSLPSDEQAKSISESIVTLKTSHAFKELSESKWDGQSFDSEYSRVYNNFLGELDRQSGLHECVEKFNSKATSARINVFELLVQKRPYDVRVSRVVKDGNEAALKEAAACFKHRAYLSEFFKGAN